jgi:hypothetical protein
MCDHFITHRSRSTRRRGASGAGPPGTTPAHARPAARRTRLSSRGPWRIPREQLPQFCGDASVDPCNVCHRDTDDEDDDGSTGELICSVPLVCVEPKDSAARRCYPQDPATQKAYTNFECAGVVPDV